MFTGWEISRRRDRADSVARLEGKGDGRVGLANIVSLFISAMLKQDYMVLFSHDG